MTITRYNFDAGTNGANLAAGGGIVEVSPGAPTYSTAAAFHGARGLNSTATQWAGWAVPNSDWSAGAYFKMTASPGTGSQRVVQFRNATPAFVGGIRFHSNGSIQISNASNVLIGSQSTTTWALNDPFRFDWQWNQSGADADITLRIFKGSNVDGTTPDEVMTRTITGATPTTFRLGGLESAAWSVDWDSVSISDILEWIGPFSPPLTPLDTPVVTVTGTTDPTAPAATDGTITVTWPAVAGTDHYAAGIATGHGQTSGFTIVSSAATSPYTFTGLGAGNYTVAIRAVPA